MKKAVMILPTYNEKQCIESFIKEVFNAEKNISGWTYEVLVADSHSPDGTYDIVQKIAKENRKVHAIKVGFGLGVGSIEGYRYAIDHFKPDVLVHLDADGQVGAEHVNKLLGVIDEGYEFAVGSRLMKGGRNELSPLRRFFTFGASLFCRLVMGPFNITEFTNSTRAFTPALFKRINLDIIPWKEKTFISQPAFLHAAIEAGAKYKEVPIIFENREEGYSKNKVFNYTYDIITYCIDVRLHKWGINIPFFSITRKAKTIVKFGLVGVAGTLVDFMFYKVFINMAHLPPASSKGLSAEIAILNNFALNNFWTFRYRKTKTNIWQRFAIFNLVSLGGLAISVLIVKFLHDNFGDGVVRIGSVKAAYNNFYFFATIPPVMIWNFTVNHFITWRHKSDHS